MAACQPSPCYPNQIRKINIMLSGRSQASAARDAAVLPQPARDAGQPAEPGVRRSISVRGSRSCSQQRSLIGSRFGPAAGRRRAHRHADGPDARLGADGRLRRRRSSPTRARAGSTAIRRRPTRPSHAGLEQITSDLSTLFVTDFSPTTAQIAALRANPPALPGFTFIAPGGAAGSGYWVQPRFTDAGGNPRPEDTVIGSAITVGPYQGFRGIITPYDITVTARSRGGAEVRMRRTLQTVAIPVFQFGMFSETDLAFHAGAEAFNFGGRVHTNGNLFLAAANGGSLDHRRSHHGGQGRRSGRTCRTAWLTTERLHGHRADSDDDRDSARRTTSTATCGVDEGSITGTVPPTQTPVGSRRIRLGRAVAGHLSEQHPQRRHRREAAEPAARRRSRQQRRAGRAADRAHSAARAGLEREHRHASRRGMFTRSGSSRWQACGSCCRTRPPRSRVCRRSQRRRRSRSSGPLTCQRRHSTTHRRCLTSCPALLSGTTKRRARRGVAGGPNSAGAAAGKCLQGRSRRVRARRLHQDRDSTAARRRPGTDRRVWQDVTARGARAGYRGTKPRRLPTEPIASRWNNVPDSWRGRVPWEPGHLREPHPNAIIRLQRVRDIPIEHGALRHSDTVGGDITAHGPRRSARTSTTTGRTSSTTRAKPRRGTACRQHGPALSGRDALRRARRQQSSPVAGRRNVNAPFGAPNGPLAKNDNGYIVYFSDRRNNKNGVCLQRSGDRRVRLRGCVESDGGNGAAERCHGRGHCRLARRTDESLACVEDFNDNHAAGRLRAHRPERLLQASAATCRVWRGFPNPLRADIAASTSASLTGRTALAIGCSTALGRRSALCKRARRLCANVPCKSVGRSQLEGAHRRANRTLFFRRALKLVNGGIVGGVNSLPPGLTIAAENPVYVQGNYNSDGNAAWAAGNVPAAVIADAVTLLSNDWNDIRSFTSPTDSMAIARRPRRAIGWPS